MNDADRELCIALGIGTWWTVLSGHGRRHFATRESARLWRKNHGSPDDEILAIGHPIDTEWALKAMEEEIVAALLGDEAWSESKSGDSAIEVIAQSLLAALNSGALTGRDEKGSLT